MAVFERLESEHSAPWIRMAGGTLRMSDLDWLMHVADTSGAGPVTVDIRALEELTPEGCQVLSELAEHVRRVDRVFTVLRPREGSLTEVLAVTGTLRDIRIHFAETANPPRA